MNIDITEHAIWKFPKNNLSDLYWVWFSEQHSSIFFSLENKIAVYNDLLKEWLDISLDEYVCDTECAEALTTTDNYLVFAGFAGDFEVYEMPYLRYITTIETQNSGYGAASFKNSIFINCHDPLGIQMVEIPSGQIIRKFSILDVFSEDYLLNSIATNKKYVVGFFEELSTFNNEDEKDPSNYYVTWNLHDGSLISKIKSIYDGYEDPILTKDNLIINYNKIYNLITSEILLELDLQEAEYFVTVLENFAFILNEAYNSENDIKRIQIYNIKEQRSYENFEIEADKIYTFKNNGDFVLILKEDHFYLTSFKNLITLL
ncbi:MAG: hypothetical protein ACXACX_10520 [Candidatus Hodarchaeales archaeon]|jgi:hypothetical protein